MSQWFIRSADATWGPFALKQLQAMAAAAQVQPGMLASRDQVGWITVGQIPGLVFPQPGLAPVTAVNLNLAPVSVVPVNVAPVSVVPVRLVPVSVAPISLASLSVVPDAAATAVDALSADRQAVESQAVDSPGAVQEPAADEMPEAAAPATRPRLSRAMRRKSAAENEWVRPAAAIGGGLALLLVLIVYFSGGPGPQETAAKRDPPKAAPRSEASAVKASTTSTRGAPVERGGPSTASAQRDDRRAAPRIELDETSDLVANSLVDGGSRPTSDAQDAVAPAETTVVAAVATAAPPARPVPANEPADDAADEAATDADAVAESTVDEKPGPASNARKLVAAFRRTKSPAERDKLVDQTIELGRPAVEQLLTAINQEIRGQLRAYNKRVTAVARSKVAAQIGAEVDELRAQIIAVRDREELTKEMIVDEVDPALARLSGLLLNGSVLVDRSPNLQKQREGLLQVGKYWERCVNHLAESLPPDSKAPRQPANFESYLQGEENMILEPASLPPQARAILAQNAKLAERLDAEEARAILACNATRCLVGLTPLAIDPALCAAARDHSQDMEKLDFFSHDSSVAGKKDPWERAKNFGTTASGENIYRGITDGGVVHQGWMHSPGHFTNLLGEHARIGVGRSGTYFTQMFGK